MALSLGSASRSWRSRSASAHRGIGVMAASRGARGARGGIIGGVSSSAAAWRSAGAAALGGGGAAHAQRAASCARSSAALNGGIASSWRWRRGIFWCYRLAARRNLASRGGSAYRESIAHRRHHRQPKTHRLIGSIAAKRHRGSGGSAGGGVENKRVSHRGASSLAARGSSCGGAASLSASALIAS